jgi:hypothetical protein
MRQLPQMPFRDTKGPGCIPWPQCEGGIHFHFIVLSVGEYSVEASRFFWSAVEAARLEND